MNFLAPIRQNRRARLGVELGALGLLGGMAFWLWSSPARHERSLRDASLERLTETVRKEPTNARAGYWLGVRRRQLGDLAGARAAFQAVANLSDDDEDIWLAWASSAGAIGATKEAFSVLSTYTRTHPKSEAAHLALAVFYREQDARLRAFEEAQAVTRLNPMNVAAWQMLGAEALEVRRFPEAEDALKTALRLQPGDWRSQLALGNVLRNVHRDDEASVAFEKAIALAPKESVPRRALGRLKYERASIPQELKAAESALREVLALEPRDTETMLLLGQCLSRQKRPDEALGLWEKAAQLSPDAPKVFYELARAYQNKGDSRRAEAARKRHAALDRFEREIYSLRVKISQVQDDGALRLQLARLLATQRRDAEAAREFRRLIARGS